MKSFLELKNLVNYKAFAKQSSQLMQKENLNQMKVKKKVKMKKKKDQK
jgi:hypothetical protein